MGHVPTLAILAMLAASSGAFPSLSILFIPIMVPKHPDPLPAIPASSTNFRVAARDWKLPETSAALSIIYFISVTLISMSVIACTIVGYIDYLRWKGKPPPKWFLWLGARKGGKWMSKFWKGKVGAVPNGLDQSEEDSRQNGVRPTGMSLREMGRPGNAGWLNIESNHPGTEESGGAGIRETDEENQAPMPRRNPGWIDIVQEAETCRQQRHCPLPPLGMAVGPPPLGGILVVKKQTSDG